MPCARHVVFFPWIEPESEFHFWLDVKYTPPCILTGQESDFQKEEIRGLMRPSIARIRLEKRRTFPVCTRS